MAIPFIDVALKLLDKVIPDPQARAQAQVTLIEANQRGEFKGLEERMGAIKTEASSTDPWTSRARPSFLYVMYTLILTSIPAGLLYVFHPAEVKLFIEGFKLFLDAIPGELYALFGAGYLGYTHYRSADKKLDKL